MSTGTLSVQRRTVELARREVGGSFLVFVVSEGYGERNWHIMGRVAFGDWRAGGARYGKTRTLHFGDHERIAWECWRATIRACLAATEPRRRRTRKAAARG